MYNYLQFGKFDLNIFDYSFSNIPNNNSRLA